MRSVANNTKIKNKMKLQLPSLSVNEGMARAAVAAFVSQLDPSVTELADIKCAVSEAVTNAIVHGYRDYSGMAYITVTVSILAGRSVKIEIKDKGCGIENITQAMQPLYTTDPDSERSGMGFSVMQTFMDSVNVKSRPGEGTIVVMRKRLEDGE